jgi:predicted nucleic acid-binding protein
MATMDAEALFIDTNILVYANVLETPFHGQALIAINTAHQAGRNLWISRQVIREYLVTLTRPQAFQNLPRATVLEQIGQFIERFEIADDTTTVTEQLLQLLKDYQLGGKQVHDANIVATMKTYGIPALLTHNKKDFERFAQIIYIEGF